MEENNYRDEFELFLKESADEFKMVPSRKVWYSLYNNLHPDKKWPSMAVCLFMLTAILYIGIANNNSINRAAKIASSENFSTLLNQKNIDTKITFSAKDYSTVKEAPSSDFSLISSEKNIDISHLNERIEIGDNNSSVIETTENISTNDGTTNTQLLTENKIAIVQNIERNKNVNIAKTTTTANTTSNAVVNEEAEKDEDIFPVLQNENIALSIDAGESFNQKNSITNVDKSWVEDYAFRNKPAIKKLKQNGSLSYYITPSVGYRILSKTNKSKSTTASFALARANNDETEFANAAALNLEVGAVLQYNISKKLRLKGGVQFNYTNYVSNVTALGHPLETSLTLNNNNYSRSSNFSTKAGNNKINKSTVQVSLPMGADFRLAGNDKIGWYAGGSLQPTYVLGGSAYALSADEKYYISENDLLRKFNLNTSIESFVSFKSSSGIILNVGPQFRYQLFSTYKKAYGYTENLYNVGVKIGVATSF